MRRVCLQGECQWVDIATLLITGCLARERMQSGDTSEVSQRTYLGGLVAVVVRGGVSMCLV